MSQIKLPDLAGPEFKANPHPFYARLRAEAPVHHTTYFGYRLCFITRYDDVVLALKDERLSKDWK